MVTALLVMVLSAAGYIKAEGAINTWREQAGQAKSAEREEAETDFTRAKALQFVRRRETHGAP